MVVRPVPPGGGLTASFDVVCSPFGAIPGTFGAGGSPFGDLDGPFGVVVTEDSPLDRLSDRCVPFGALSPPGMPFRPAGEILPERFPGWLVIS